MVVCRGDPPSLQMRRCRVTVVPALTIPKFIVDEVSHPPSLVPVANLAMGEIVAMPVGSK